jgi:hypothetical protein
VACLTTNFLNARYNGKLEHETIKKIGQQNFDNIQEKTAEGL